MALKLPYAHRVPSGVLIVPPKLIGPNLSNPASLLSFLVGIHKKPKSSSLSTFCLDRSGQKLTEIDSRAKIGNMDKLLTIKEVARYLRVSERSVLRYIEAGKLKATKIGYWRIKKGDLEKFLEESSKYQK